MKNTKSRFAKNKFKKNMKGNDHVQIDAYVKEFNDNIKMIESQMEFIERLFVLGKF
ncbi:MAG: hypothetical protein KAH33_04530 [Candidatus Delongbacteria bacterium]|nr:hypothetical protein [Candidatus Delongbacteria bacterium]